MDNRSKWRPEMEEQVYRLALLGATNKQIADFYGLPERTIERWNSVNDTFHAAMQRGKMEADMKVAAALFRKATGYSYRETTNITRRNKETGELEIVRQEIVEKHHSPDAYACLKWLALRHRLQWSEVNRTSMDITYRGELDVTMVREQLKDPALSIEELKLALKMGLTQIAQDASN